MGKQTVDIDLGPILVEQKIPYCKQTADGLLYSILSQYSNRNGRHLALIDPYLSFGEVPSEVIELPSEIYGEETFFYHPVMYDDHKTNPEKCLSNHQKRLMTNGI